MPTLSPTRRVFRKKQKKADKNDLAAEWAAKVEAQQEELLRKKQEEQEDQLRAFEDLHQKKFKKQHQEEQQEEEFSDYWNPKQDSYSFSGKKQKKGRNDYY